MLAEAAAGSARLTAAVASAMRRRIRVGLGARDPQAAGAALGGPGDVGLAVADGPAEGAARARAGEEAALDREPLAGVLEAAVLVDLAAEDDVAEEAVFLHLT